MRHFCQPVAIPYYDWLIQSQILIDSVFLSLCQFIGATRPDGSEQIDSIISSFGELGKNILKLPVPTMEISSTDSGAASAWACPSAI